MCSWNHYYKKVIFKRRLHFISICYTNIYIHIFAVLTSCNIWRRYQKNTFSKQSMNAYILIHVPQQIIQFKCALSMTKSFINFDHTCTLELTKFSIVNYCRSFEFLVAKFLWISWIFIIYPRTYIQSKELWNMQHINVLIFLASQQNYVLMNLWKYGQSTKTGPHEI